MEHILAFCEEGPVSLGLFLAFVLFGQSLELNFPRLRGALSMIRLIHIKFIFSKKWLREATLGQVILLEFFLEHIPSPIYHIFNWVWIEQVWFIIALKLMIESFCIF